jgi:hypothetical protein
LIYHDYVLVLLEFCVRRTLNLNRGGKA